MTTEIIESTEFNENATVINLDSTPTLEDQELLFDIDESIVLCF